MKVKEADIVKTAFNIRHGHYELFIKPFGVINMLVIFFNLINKIFWEYLDQDKLSKCIFLLKNISFLRYRVRCASIFVDPQEVWVVTDWPMPTMVSKICKIWLTIIISL